MLNRRRQITESPSDTDAYWERTESAVYYKQSLLCVMPNAYNDKSVLSRLELRTPHNLRAEFHRTVRRMMTFYDNHRYLCNVYDNRNCIRNILLAKTLLISSSDIEAAVTHAVKSDAVMYIAVKLRLLRELPR